MNIFDIGRIYVPSGFTNTFESEITAMPLPNNKT